MIFRVFVISVFLVLIFRLQHSDLDGNDVQTLHGLKLVHPFGVAVYQGNVDYRMTPSITLVNGTYEGRADFISYLKI